MNTLLYRISYLHKKYSQDENKMKYISIMSEITKALPTQPSMSGWGLGRGKIWGG